MAWVLKLWNKPQQNTGIDECGQTKHVSHCHVHQSIDAKSRDSISVLKEKGHISSALIVEGLEASEMLIKC